ncbi:hypothetical protein U1872_21155 [Sphingomonas sp. RB3P16]|uniref:hypothetical protein n=1 Tax=Parasphingomonas frigoris TaxID=3096163 RepID=UPI002FC5B7A0
MRALPQPGARTVILDLLSTRERETCSAAEIVRAGSAFGIEATGMRTAITRLKADHRIRQVARGLYAPGEASEPLQRRLQGWRTIIDRRGGWSGGWLLVVISSAERADRSGLRRTMRALDFGGFAEAEGGIWVRPENLHGGVATVRAELTALGALPSMLMARTHDFDVAREARLRSLWNMADVEPGYRSLAAALDAHGEHAFEEPLATAAATTLILGREAIRRLVHDPLLPDELGGVAALTDLLAAMTRYDRIGQLVWRRFLTDA